MKKAMIFISLILLVIFSAFNTISYAQIRVSEWEVSSEINTSNVTLSDIVIFNPYPKCLNPTGGPPEPRLDVYLIFYNNKEEVLGYFRTDPEFPLTPRDILTVEVRKELKIPNPTPAGMGTVVILALKAPSTLEPGTNSSIMQIRATLNQTVYNSTSFNNVLGMAKKSIPPSVYVDDWFCEWPTDVNWRIITNN